MASLRHRLTLERHLRKEQISKCFMFTLRPVSMLQKPQDMKVCACSVARVATSTLISRAVVKGDGIRRVTRTSQLVAKAGAGSFNGGGFGGSFGEEAL